MNLRKQAISGVKWTTLSTIILAVLQIIKLSVLTRFLEKSDFGLMAIIMFVMGFTNLFIDMGLSTAILHKQKISLKEYASLYWINVFISIILYLLIFIITPLISSLYNEPELNKLIPLMSLTLIASAIGRQFKTIEQKELNFKLISLIDIFSALLSLIFAVILAVYNYGVYALIYSGMLLHFFSNFSYLFFGLIKRKNIFFHFSFWETKSFLRIGIYDLGGQIINYFRRDFDILIIGKVFGPELLGGYSLAKQLVFRPAQILNPILTKVGAPVLSKFQNNIIELKNNYLKLLNIVSFINFISYLFIIIFAKYIVLILYGKTFLDIVVIVQLLSIYMFIRSLHNPVGSLIIATGKTNLGFYWNLLTLIITPIIIYLASFYSISAIALFMAITMLVLFPFFWYFFIYRLLKVSFSDYVYNIFNYKKTLQQIYNYRHL